MLSVVILVGAVGGGFVLSYCFLTWILFANFEIKNARWLGLFSGTFAVSVGLFTFYSLDILQVDSATYRSIECYVLLIIYQLFLMLVLPVLLFVKLCQCYRTLLVPVLYMLYAMLIYFASQKVAGLYVFVDFFSFLGSLDRQIPCFAMIGAVCSGLLAGCAAITTIERYYLLRPPTEEEIELAGGLENRWTMILRDLAAAKKHLAIFRRNQPIHGGNDEKKGLLSRIMSVVTTSKPDGQEELVRRIQGLQLMQEEIYANLLDYYAEKANADYARTCLGRIEGLFGKIAGVVCVVKMILSVKCLIVGQLADSGGLINTANDFIGKFFPSLLANESLPVWEQHICFILVLIFLITNVNSILTNLQAIYKRLMKNYAYTFAAGSLIIVSSYLAASYFLTSVLMMASNLPPKDSSLLHQMYALNKEALTITWNVTYLSACFLAVAFHLTRCAVKSL